MLSGESGETVECTVMAVSHKSSEYVDKLKYLGLETCPYEIPASEWIDDVSVWPPVTYPDIYNYLIESSGQYTPDSLKAYKSLDAYNFVVSGWVKPLYILKADSRYNILTSCSFTRCICRLSRCINMHLL